MLDLAPEYCRIVVDIVRQHAPTAKIYVFGSRTQGVAKPHSDLDLLIDAKEGIPLQQRACLRMAFEDSDLPMRVDWHVLQEMPEYLQKQARLDPILSI